MYPTMKTVLDHIAAGRKIDAIKALRIITHMGLKEAKDMVEAVEPCVRKAPEIPVQLFGQPLSYWAELDSMMREHDIRSPRDLGLRLKKPKADPMAGRVEIRDTKNTARLLGSIPRPNWNGGRHFQMAAMGRISCVPFDPCAEMTTSVTHVQFEADIIRTSPLDVQAVLTTYASLKDLLKLRDFRLPGETEEQAHVRGMYA